MKYFRKRHILINFDEKITLLKDNETDKRQKDNWFKEIYIYVFHF